MCSVYGKMKTGMGDEANGEPQDLQDETISLNLQINVAEQKAAKLQKENKDLIDRWMARMGQEADALNRASNF